MPRIAGVDIPNDKQIMYALTYIYGVGTTKSRQILEEAEVPLTKRAKDLDANELSRIRKILETKEKVEGDLRRETQMDIKRLMDLGSYRGIRHRRRLPVRGQRTKTNARTRKGKSSPIAGKKIAGKK